jgi:serine/threonine protein phosphatase 1
MRDPDPSQKYASLTDVRRVWAVGSIHGDADRLKAVHAKISGRFVPGDRIVYLGNYIGHGTQICAVLDELLEFRRRFLRPGMEAGDIVYLRGAQEEMWRKCLELQFAPNPSEVFEWMLGQGLEATLHAYNADLDQARAHLRDGALSITRWTTKLRESMQSRPGHDELLNAVVRAATTENGRVLFVHAGLDPAKPMSEQGDILWWGAGFFDQITEAYGDVQMIVRGYDRAHRGLAMTRHTATVDSGCGFGGRLAVACFDSEGRALEWIEV